MSAIQKASDRSSRAPVLAGNGEDLHDYSLRVRNKRHIEQPLYYSGKWWARRLAGVTAWMISQALPDGPGTVLDPFMGSGTTIGEALRLGHSAIGVEVNPFAAAVGQQAFQPRHPDLQVRYEQIVSEALRDVEQLYELGPNSPAGYFWAYARRCPSCRRSTLLLNRRVLVQHAYRWIVTAGWAICPYSRDVFPIRDVNATKARCPCGRFVQLSVAVGGVRFRCAFCNFPVNPWGASDETRLPPRPVLVAVELRKGNLRTFRRPTKREVDAASARGQPVPNLPIMPIHRGRSTAQVLAWGYSDWQNLLHPRQRLLAHTLSKRIALVKDQALRQALAIAFAPMWEYHSRLCSFKGIGSGAVRQALGTPVIHPVPISYEANPLQLGKGARASGDPRGWFHQRTARSAQAFVELERHRGVPVRCGTLISVAAGQADVAVLCANSANVAHLPDSVDAIVTDPPYFDRIYYDDLAGPLVAWLRYCGVVCQSFGTGIQGASVDGFARRLREALAPAIDALRPGGSLIFTYHHQDPAAWLALALALTPLPLTGFAVSLVPSEMPHSRMKQRSAAPISCDAVIHLKKGPRNKRPPEIERWSTQMRQNLADVRVRLAGDDVSGAYAAALLAGLSSAEVHSWHVLLDSARSLVTRSG
jgi:putative DNA methylase